MKKKKTNEKKIEGKIEKEYHKKFKESFTGIIITGTTGISILFVSILAIISHLISKGFFYGVMSAIILLGILELISTKIVINEWVRENWK